MSTISYRRHRFPPEIIQHAVWLYFRFPLSYRDVEDLLAECGIDLSYETVRRWALKFGRLYAQRLRRLRPRPSGRWHLDEVFARIGGQRVYLWRAVDDEGEVLDILVQRKQDRRAALKLLRKLLQKQGFAPEAWITDKLASYGAALRDLGMTKLHITGGRINNRAENSHLPVRQRERRMLGFKTPTSAQRFLSTQSAIYNTFNIQRHGIVTSTGGVGRSKAVAVGMSNVSYTGYRFPAAVIQHAVWLYFRFSMSYRDVEDLLAERGIDVSYETVRRWALKFGPAYARRLRRRRPRPSDRWHLDEVFVKIRGKTSYLWRAVDDEGEVLEILVQSRRDKRAALKLMRKLLQKQGYVPETIVTDRLRSYGAALRSLGLDLRHVQGGRSNNRAEVSHQPTRQRERASRSFKSPGSAQRFLSIHAAVYNQFNLQRHLGLAPHLWRASSA